MYNETSAPLDDPYSEAYNAPAPPSSGAQMSLDPTPGAIRARSRSPVRGDSRDSPRFRARSPPPKPKHAPATPKPTNVLGVFGLSIRTTERDLDAEFSRFGRVEKVVIVYDQRSDRSRGFGFITLATVEDATRCVQELNGIDLNGRRIRVDYSTTDRPHAPTPGEYMGHRRSAGREYDRRDRGPYRDAYRSRYDDRSSRYDDRDRYDRYDRDRYDRSDDYGRDRDPYERDRDWRRRSPPPRRGYSPERERRRRSYSRSPPRGGTSPMTAPRMARDYDLPPPSSGPTTNGDRHW